MFCSKKLSFFLVPLSLLSMYSCNNDNTSPNAIVIPVVWGRLSAIVQEKIIISGADTITNTSEMAMASFISDPSTPNVFVDAGTVSVNNIDLTRNSTNHYQKEASAGQTPASLDLTNKIEWYVTGGGSIPQLGHSDVAVFPEYLPALPYAVSKSAGLDLVFDSTTVVGADSVRVLIDDANGNTVARTFSARAGAVTIPSTSLTSLSNVSDQTGAIAIMPYKGTVKAFLNKGMYFMRERRLFQSININ